MCSDFLFRENNYEWDGIQKINYKKEEGVSNTFSNVVRQNIVEKNDSIKFDLRYFECGPEGFTSLEKHEHTHVVLVLRGTGKVIIGKDVFDVEANDCFIIPGTAAHQLINTSVEPFGFICVVDQKRDSYKLLNKNELDTLKSIPETALNMRVTESYGE